MNKMTSNSLTENEEHGHGWGTPFRREVYRCDFCDGFVMTFVTVSVRPRQIAAIHQLKMVTAITGIKTRQIWGIW